MIKSFAEKETEKVFNRQFSKRLPTEIQRIILRKLVMLDAAENINDLRIPPSNHLEKLKGSKNQHSIRVNDQWRICFLWQEGNVFDVEVVDYHKGK
ncbi:MAG: type II toxin-antitoxin system RelE/ParE family toxin [Anaerolineae bacterium]|nr:type II toxin-antitoxin system RelE/ParE family toxin [Anaerolineae bacterium]